MKTDHHFIEMNDTLKTLNSQKSKPSKLIQDLLNSQQIVEEKKDNPVNESSIDIEISESGDNLKSSVPINKPTDVSENTLPKQKATTGETKEKESSIEIDISESIEVQTRNLLLTFL